MKAISADVLSIALYNQEITREFVQTALASVSCQNVEDWQTDNVCHNRYGLRRKMDEELKSVGREPYQTEHPTDSGMKRWGFRSCERIPRHRTLMRGRTLE